MIVLWSKTLYLSIELMRSTSNSHFKQGVLLLLVSSMCEEANFSSSPKYFTLLGCLTVGFNSQFQLKNLQKFKLTVSDMSKLNKLTKFSALSNCFVLSINSVSRHRFYFGLQKHNTCIDWLSLHNHKR